MTGEMDIEVLDEHTDTLGHLNHVRAVWYFEQARGCWFRECGLDVGDAGNQFGTVVVNINYDYRQECFLGEHLKVLTIPVSFGRKSLVLAHELLKPDGSVAIEGSAVSVVMDLRERATVPVPECLRRHFPAT